jgi:hypothetical protein
MTMAYPLAPFPREGERKRSPMGKLTACPPSPAPWAGVTGHLPRLAGEDGWGCCHLNRASAGGPAEAA